MNDAGPGCVLCNHQGVIQFEGELVPCMGCVETWPPPRPPRRGVRWHLALHLLGVGDRLVVAGHALGRLANWLSPHP